MKVLADDALSTVDRYPARSNNTNMTLGKVNPKEAY